jgi:hypothetical protein
VNVGLRPGLVIVALSLLTLAAVDRTLPGGRLVCLDLQLPMLRKLRQALGARTPALVCASANRAATAPHVIVRSSFFFMRSANGA